MNAAGSHLGERLGVKFVFLAQFDPEQAEGTVYVIWNDGQARPLPSRGHLADYVEDEVIAALREGQTVVCRDAESDSRTHAEAYRAIGMRSWVMVPFRRGGDLKFMFCVADPEPREWRDDEVELLRDVAVRVLPRLERARAEEALRSSEERFRTIVTTANEGISMMGSDGRITFVNDQFAESLGYSVDEIIGRRPAELSADQDAEKLEGELRGRHQGGAGQYDLRLKTKDGASIWFLISAAPIYDSGGDIVGAVGMFTDIDERKRQEAALALQAHLLENVHDAICAFDESYRVTYWNRAAEEFFGWTREEAVGRAQQGPAEGQPPGLDQGRRAGDPAARRVVQGRGPVPAQGRARDLGRRPLAPDQDRGRRRGGRGRHVPRHRRAEAGPGGPRLGGGETPGHRRSRPGRTRDRGRRRRGPHAQRHPAQHLGGRGAGAVRRRVRGLQGVLAGDRRATEGRGLAGGPGPRDR